MSEETETEVIADDPRPLNILWLDQGPGSIWVRMDLDGGYRQVCSVLPISLIPPYTMEA